MPFRRDGPYPIIVNDKISQSAGIASIESEKSASKTAFSCAKIAFVENFNKIIPVFKSKNDIFCEMGRFSIRSPAMSEIPRKKGLRTRKNYFFLLPPPHWGYYNKCKMNDDDNVWFVERANPVC
jgi:hypothetical protein